MPVLPICSKKSLAVIAMILKYIVSKESIITGKKNKGSFSWKCISIHHWLFKIRSCHPFQGKFFSSVIRLSKISLGTVLFLLIYCSKWVYQGYSWLFSLYTENLHWKFHYCIVKKVFYFISIIGIKLSFEIEKNNS